MMIRLRFLLPLVIFLLIVLLFWYGLDRDPNLLPSLLVDKPVPTFSAESLGNTSELISSVNFKGKVTLLNVWATWCSMCSIEHPLLIDIAKNKEVQMIGLNYKDERQAALKYLMAAGNPYQETIYDPEGKIAMQWGVYGTPETFLIDKKGIVRYRYVGPITLEILEKDLLPRIKKIVWED